MLHTVTVCSACIVYMVSICVLLRVKTFYKQGKNQCVLNTQHSILNAQCCLILSGFSIFYPLDRIGLTTELTNDREKMVNPNPEPDPDLPCALFTLLSFTSASVYRQL